MENRTVAEVSKELAATVMESEEYKNYLACRAELDKNPQLLQAVNEMRKFNFELQNAEGVTNMYDEVVKIFDKYSYVRKNVTANRFLRAEMSLCRMMQEMIRTIFEDIEFDVDFID